MLHFFNKRNVNALKLTNFFSAGFSYSPSFSLFLFAIIIAIIIIEDLIGLPDYSLYSFLVFSYLNKNRKYPHIKDATDEEIEEAKFYQNITDMDDDEKTFEFYLKRDMHFNGDDYYDDSSFEKLPLEIANQFKESLNKINEENYQNTLEAFRKAPKDSFLKLYVLKTNWEELLKEGKSPYRDDNDFKTNKKSSKSSKTPFRFYKKSSKLSSKSNTSNAKRSYSTYMENPSLRDDNLKLNKKAPFLTYSPVYLKIKEIYEDKNKDVVEKQREVEYLINEKWLDLYISKNKGNNSEDAFLLLNTAMNKFTIKLSAYFNTKKKSFQKFLPLIEMKKHDIAFIVFNELKPILNLGTEINSTTLSGNIGKSLYGRWIRELYLSEKQINKDLDFNKFKENYTFKEEDYHDVGDLLRQILLEDDDLFYRRIDKTDAKDTKAFITASCKVQEIFQHHHDVIGLQLAMICPPVKWSDGNYGGFLRNKEKLFMDLITPSSKSKMKSVIENELIYDSVNYLSSTPYKINTQVLDFINLNANEIGLLQNLHPETNKLEEYYGIINNKSTPGSDKTISRFLIKKIIKDVLSFNSNYYLEKNILGLANLYRLVDQFFFTISLDWRGRLYSESTYLNFQGNDLSKALILFKNGKIINTEGVHYLKIYGANLYGNNKLSFMDRTKWIDENIENILNMDLDFINKADKKFLFIAFCFEYKNYLSNPTEFKTHLPILLDASCNGMQHLSAMIGDSVIAKNVNLLENDPYLKPYDFYTFCLKLVKNKLDSIDPNDVNYIRIRNLKLDRSVVKRTIMTIPYNVSIHTITTQLSEFFEEIEINNEILLKPTWYTPDSELYISYKELYFLANLIHQTLYEEHPKLKAVVKYFSDIANCLTKLKLPIMWNTPAGLVIKQNYVKFKKHIVKSSLYYKSSSYTINLPTTQISLKNQKSSFMPNLIHSMDASNIYLLVDKILKANLEINIFTVHDCFATTAETMPLLNRLVRSSFIELYSDNEYLSRMDRFYRNYIIENGYIIEENNVILENKDILCKEETIKLEIPQPPISENLHLDEMIDKAIYLIH